MLGFCLRIVTHLWEITGFPLERDFLRGARRLGADRCARRGLAGEVGDARSRAADRNTARCPRDAPSTGGACPRPRGHARPPVPERVRPRGGPYCRRRVGRKNGQNRHVIFYVEERLCARRCPQRSAQLSASRITQDLAPGKPGSVRRFFAAPSIRPPTTVLTRARHPWGCLSRKIARFAAPAGAKSKPLYQRVRSPSYRRCEGGGGRVPPIPASRIGRILVHC